MSDILKTYNETLDREGYFCDICDREVRNGNGLELYEHVASWENVRICRDCYSPNA